MAYHRKREKEGSMVNAVLYEKEDKRLIDADNVETTYFDNTVT